MTMATPYPVAARELLRNTLLDAARELLRERTWDQVTMADVARAAGVSRQTLYNEFGSRHAFAVALVLREGDRFLTDVEQALLAHRDDAAAALEAAVGVFLGTAAQDPLVRAIATGQGDGDDSLLPLVTTQGEPVVGYAVERLSGAIATGWPAAAASDVALLADALVRLGISYAALPSGTPQDTAAALRRLLAPFIERALG